MIWILLLIMAFMLFYYLFIMPQLYWKNKNIDQGPPIPFFGDILRNFLYLETTTEMFANGYKRNRKARYIGMYHGTTPVLVLRDPDLIKQITVKDFDYFVDHRTFATEQAEPIWSKNLFSLKELVVNPDIQKRLRDEVDATFKKCNGKLTYDDLNKMKYMDMVISESMRKQSPILSLDRICTKTYTIESKRPGEQPLHLKPGDRIWLPVSAIHHDPEYFPNPKKFDPERFSDENKDIIQPYTYFPFGAGPRSCIGSRFALMECKTLLFHILSIFELTVIDKTPLPLKLCKSTFSPYIKGGFWVGFKKRKM